MSDFGNHLETNDLQRSSSDEKMDTASESFPSTQDTQGTPNSILSSDFEERDQPDLSNGPVGVLRLQDPPVRNGDIEDVDGFSKSIGKCNDNSVQNLVNIESTQETKMTNLENGFSYSVNTNPLNQVMSSVDSRKSTNVLRLNNPVVDNHNYRNGDTEHNDSISEDVKHFKLDYDEEQTESPVRCGDSILNDSLTNRMSGLRLDSVDTPEDKRSRPLGLGVSPPRLSSTLTLTSDHPLMGESSPGVLDNYPDLVPEKPRIKKCEEDPKDVSLSSVEDYKYPAESDFYQDGVYRNTSKNNLYFSDNFSTCLESKSVVLSSTPDVARVQNGSKSFDGAVRRKIIPIFRETEHIVNRRVLDTPKTVLGRDVEPNLGEKAINAYVEERNKKAGSQEVSVTLPKIEDSGRSSPLADSGPVDWVESPSHLRSMPNFELPVEMSSPRPPEECASPEALSSSTQEEDRSTYQAMVDPYSGNVALKHTAGQNHHQVNRRRRIIALVDTEDRCSLDSASASSIDSEEAEPSAEGCGTELETGGGEGAPDGSRDSEDDSRGNSRSESSEPIPEYPFEEEMSNVRNWLKITLPTGGYLRCDMKVIEPYKRVISHGGYRGRAAHIIVFSACHLPDSARRDYSYVMDNLFLYVVHTLDNLVSEEYELVYLHGSASKHRMPNFHWLKKSYHLVDRRLRKSLKHLYLVHPTFWLKSIVFMSKPFISSKFSRKLSYVHSLAELYERVPVEPAAIPDLVKEFDSNRHR